MEKSCSFWPESNGNHINQNQPATPFGLVLLKTGSSRFLSFSFCSDLFIPVERQAASAHSVDDEPGSQRTAACSALFSAFGKFCHSLQILTFLEGSTCFHLEYLGILSVNPCERFLRMRLNTTNPRKYVERGLQTMIRFCTKDPQGLSP